MTTVYYPQPIHISLLDFIAQGKFDVIEVGQSKDYIKNNFPLPDSYWSDELYKTAIWTYSTVEFHFNEEKLFLIWCDNIRYISSTNALVFDSWILQNTPVPTLQTLLIVLSDLKLNFEVKHTNKYSTSLTVLQSNVKLHFEDADDIGMPYSERPLIAFGLTHFK